MDNQQDQTDYTDQEQEIKKPSIFNQVLPYVFTAAILAWVFTGLSSNVVDERHTFNGKQWETLNRAGVKIGSIEVKSLDGAAYCGAVEGEKAECPEGLDYEVSPRPDQDQTALRRTADSSIPDRTEVSVDYVKKVRLSEMWAMVKAADLRFFIPVMILHTLIFLFGDVFSFGLAYRFFNVPGIKIRELLEVRGAPYIIQVGLAAFAEIFFPLYMWRVKKVPVTETLSSNLWTMIIDTAAIFSLITPAVIYNVFVDNIIPVIGYPWVVVCGIYWVLFFSNAIFWHTALGQRTAERIAADRGGAKDEQGLKKSMGGGLQILRTFSIARWDQYLKVYLARAAVWASFLLSNYVALTALGMSPSSPMAMIGIPLVVVSIFMPIGVGGYGGPQLIAWFVFVELGQAGTADQVIAYSLLFSTAFLIGRAAIGMVFIRGFWKRVFS